jgi:hypothetical protein
VGIGPLPRAEAATLVSDDCDDGVNVNDGTIAGTYLKLKTKTPIAGQLWICYRVDREADPVIHEGGKLTFGVSSEPTVDDNAGYCATRPNNWVDFDAKVGPEETPLLMHRLSPPYNLEELGICIKLANVLFRASAIVRPDLANKIERDLVTCAQISGTATDMNYESNPVSGATIRQIGDAVDGCSSAALTSASGQYTLWARVAVPAQTVTLRAERTGYQPQEIVITASDPTNTLANFNLWLDATQWSDLGCEQEGNPLTGTDHCRPAGDLADTATAVASDRCLGAVLCEVTLDEALRTGFDITPLIPMEANLTAEYLENNPPPLTSATEQAAASSSSGSHASLVFWMTRDKNNSCNGSPRENGRCGWLGHAYYEPSGGWNRPTWRWTIFPSRSGDNDIARQCVSMIPRGAPGGPVQGGPINTTYAPKNQRGVPYYRVGYMRGAWTGYENRNEQVLAPGIWRLDPWDVYGCPRKRGEFEIHGGTGPAHLNSRGTHGCIRLSPEGITGLKERWVNRTPDRRNLNVYIDYSSAN